MKDHLLEFVSPGTSLKKKRGLLEVRLAENVVEIPFADIQGCIIISPDIHLSSAVLVEFLSHGICIQVTDDKYNPQGVLAPFVGHHLQNVRLSAQIALSESSKGRFWQKVITKKIQHQMLHLEKLEKNVTVLKKFSMEVKAKDEGNLEAQAARIYWRELFGDDFRRDPQMSGVNSFLNYGYAVLRSAVARSTVACGLNPSLGIFHKNMENPFCLVDDLMEPFRPYVDEIVYRYRDEVDLNTEIKKALVSVLEMPTIYMNQKKVLRSTIHDYCGSFTKAVLDKKVDFFNLDFSKN